MGALVEAEIASGEGIGMGEAASRLPAGREGAGCHPGTLVRWVLKGAKSVNGTRVYLEAARVGSRWVTTEAALRRFISALGGDAQAQALPDPGPQHRNPNSNQATIERQLEAMGVRPPRPRLAGTDSTGIVSVTPT